MTVNAHALKVAIIAQTLVNCAEELAKIAEELQKEKKQ